MTWVQQSDKGKQIQTLFLYREITVIIGTWNTCFPNNDTVKALRLGTAELGNSF